MVWLYTKEEGDFYHNFSTFIFGFAYSNSKLTYHISFSVYLMRERIASGEWPVILCTLKAISKTVLWGQFI